MVMGTWMQAFGSFAVVSLCACDMNNFSSRVCSFTSFYANVAEFGNSNAFEVIYHPPLEMSSCFLKHQVLCDSESE